MAELLAKLAAKRPGVRQAKVRIIAGCDPSAYDEVYDWFGRALAQEEDADVVYLCTTGGTPAMSQGLLLRAILRFRERCRVVYVPRGSANAEERRFVSAFLKDLRNERVAQAVRSLDFAAAFKLLEGTEGWMAPFVRYAACRMRSDFAGARVALDEAIKAAGTNERLQLTSIRDGTLSELQVATGQEFVLKAPALLEELSYNARVAFQQERYDDFLVRLVRFEEITARYLVEKHLGLPTDEANKREEIIKGVGANPPPPRPPRSAADRRDPPGLPPDGAPGLSGSGAVSGPWRNGRLGPSGDTARREG